MAQNYDSVFRVYACLCFNDRHTGDYSYLVLTNDGGLTYFTSDKLPKIVKKFLELHNKKQNVVLLDWENYIVFSDEIPIIPEHG